MRTRTEKGPKAAQESHRGAGYDGPRRAPTRNSRPAGGRGKGRAVSARAQRLGLGGLAISLVVVVGLVTLRSGANQNGAGVSARPSLGSDLHSLAVDPANPQRLLVGGHENAAISADGGKTWRQAGGLQNADPMGWVINPRDPLTMYIGGHPGFRRSADGGKTWSTDGGDLPGTDVHGLGLDPRHPTILYAYLMGQGIYRSTDAGQHWTSINTEKHVMGPILVDPRRAQTLYIDDAMQGFERSDDGGQTWHVVGLIPGGAAWITQDQQAPNTFYAANGQVLKSSNGGKTWLPVTNGLSGTVSAVAAAPSTSGYLYAAGLENGAARVFHSDDGGAHWRAQN